MDKSVDKSVDNYGTERAQYLVLRHPHMTERHLEMFEWAAMDYLRHVEARDKADDAGDDSEANLQDALAALAHAELWRHVKAQERSAQQTDYPRAVGWRVSEVISWAHGMRPYVVPVLA